MQRLPLVDSTCHICRSMCWRQHRDRTRRCHPSADVQSACKNYYFGWAASYKLCKAPSEALHSLVPTSDMMLAALHCQVGDRAVPAPAAIFSQPGSGRAQNVLVCSYACSHQYAMQLAHAWVDCRRAHRLVELCSVLCMAPEPLQLELWSGGVPVVHLQHERPFVSQAASKLSMKAASSGPLICSRSNPACVPTESGTELRRLLPACSAGRCKCSCRGPKTHWVQTPSHRPLCRVAWLQSNLTLLEHGTSKHVGAAGPESLPSCGRQQSQCGGWRGRQ